MVKEKTAISRYLFLVSYTVASSLDMEHWKVVPVYSFVQRQGLVKWGQEHSARVSIRSGNPHMGLCPLSHVRHVWYLDLWTSYFRISWMLVLLHPDSYWTVLLDFCNTARFYVAMENVQEPFDLVVVGAGTSSHISISSAITHANRMVRSRRSRHLHHSAS